MVTLEHRTIYRSELLDGGCRRPADYLDEVVRAREDPSR